MTDSSGSPANLVPVWSLQAPGAMPTLVGSVTPWASTSAGFGGCKKPGGA
jgi:hypothetical protein